MTIDPILTGVIVGKAAKEAGAKLVSESKQVGNELVSAAKDTAEFKSAATDYARRVAIRQAILTKMYAPIARMFKVSGDYFDNGFDKDMAEKLEQVPEENIIAPKPSLAAPAMQQLGFSLDEHDLKEMYLGLLATASDNRRSDSAHPSFVEVIKQLSSNETKLLNHLLSKVQITTAIVSLKRTTVGETSYRTLVKHVLNLVNVGSNQQTEEQYLATYVDNWIRLGLVHVSYTEFIADERAYDWVTQRPEFVRLASELENEGQNIEFTKGFLQPTDFGLSFAKAVGIATAGSSISDAPA